MGDTGGMKKDKNNIDQILITLQNFENLHAIIIVANGINNRKTLFFKYCLTELFTHLHKSVVKNILFCFTYSEINPGCFGKGDGFKVMKSFLEEDIKSVEIKLELGKNAFFIENNVYRFLVAKKQGYPVSNFQKKFLLINWNHSAQEFEKIFNCIFLIPLHNIKTTLSLKKVQKIVYLITQTLHFIEENKIKVEKLLNEYRNINSLLEHKTFETKVSVIEQITETFVNLTVNVISSKDLSKNLEKCTNYADTLNFLNEIEHDYFEKINSEKTQIKEIAAIFAYYIDVNTLMVSCYFITFFVFYYFIFLSRFSMFFLSNTLT